MIGEGAVRRAAAAAEGVCGCVDRDVLPGAAAGPLILPRGVGIARAIADVVADGRTPDPALVDFYRRVDERCGDVEPR